MENPLITSDPKVMLGKPVIRGTRITVELILNKLAAGRSIDDILQDYPHLTREGVVAAIEFYEAQCASAFVVITDLPRQMAEAGETVADLSDEEFFRAITIHANRTGVTTCPE